jgi:DNA-binding beta-propeller fold protein YncE
MVGARLRHVAIVGVSGLCLFPSAAGSGTHASSDNVCLRQMKAEAWCGDGGRASRAHLAHPQDVEMRRDGGYLIADTENEVIRSVSRQGIITTIAGSGREGFSGDGGPATRARLANPTAVAIEPDGGVLVADTYNNRVRRIAPTGTIVTVAGAGARAFGGDGGLATEAQLSQPRAVLPFGTGGFLVADSENHRVRLVDQGGRIITVAGNGQEGETWADGVQATQAAIGAPLDLLRARDGGFLVLTEDKLLHVRPDGSIATSVRGFRGAAGMAAERSGSIIVSEAADAAVGDRRLAAHRIWRIFVTRQTPERIAGAVQEFELCKYAGDGGQAVDAWLAGPQGLTVAPDGSILFAESESSRVRQISLDGRIDTVVGTGEPSEGGCRAGNIDYDSAWNLFYVRLWSRHAKGIAIRLVTSQHAQVDARLLRRGKLAVRTVADVRAGDRQILFRARLVSGVYALRLIGTTPEGVKKAYSGRISYGR